MFSLESFPTRSRPFIVFGGFFLLVVCFFVIPIIWVMQGDYDDKIFKHIFVYIGIGILSLLSVWIMQQFPKAKNESKGMAIARYLVPFACLCGANWAYLFFMSLWIDGFSIESIIQVSIMAFVFSVCTLLLMLLLIAPSEPVEKTYKSSSSRSSHRRIERRRY